jgi:hypothetical protein
MAKCVWALADEEVTEHMISNQDCDPKGWLFSMMETLDHDKFIWMLVTLWAIWSARRMAVHEDIFQCPLRTYEFIRRFMSDLGVIPKNNVKKMKAQGREVRKRWVAPPNGILKLNVDAAIDKHNDHEAISAVCRNFEG